MSFGERAVCPACLDTGHQIIQIALVSPWIMQIAKIKTKLRRTALSKCDMCGTAYFRISYGEVILKAIYEKYRGERYFQIRHSWEKSYSKKLNSGLSNDVEWMKWRRNAVEKVLLGAGLDLNQPISCVDIGGGEGGVIPDFPNGKKFVFDSNLELNLPSDVTRLSDYSQLNAANPDLIMCCGLLEHLNSPTEFLENLLQFSKDTTFYYFEVPVGIPKPRNRFSASFFFQKVITSNRLIWKFFSWLDYKVVTVGFPSVMPLKLTEHLNFFSENGLRVLLEGNNLSVISISKFSTNYNLPDSQGISFTNAWQVLAKKLN